MSSSKYPTLLGTEDLEWTVSEIVRIRNDEDVRQYFELDQKFLPGRSTARVPSAPDDIQNSDRLGDVVYNQVTVIIDEEEVTITYEYKLIKIGEGLVWRRIEVDTNW